MIWSESVPTVLTILGLAIVAGLIAAIVRQASLKSWGNVASLAVAAVAIMVAPWAIDHMSVANLLPL